MGIVVGEASYGYGYIAWGDVAVVVSDVGDEAAEDSSD